MAVARSKFYGWCSDKCRRLSRRAMIASRTLDRLADWFWERSF